MSEKFKELGTYLLPSMALFVWKKLSRGDITIRSVPSTALVDLTDTSVWYIYTQLIDSLEDIVGDYEYTNLFPQNELEELEFQLSEEQIEFEQAWSESGLEEDDEFFLIVNTYTTAVDDIALVLGSQLTPQELLSLYQEKLAAEDDTEEEF